MVTWGITPSQSVGVDDNVPGVEAFEESERPSVKEAYEYMQMDPSAPLAGKKIDVAFVGSCTNGRMSDFEVVIDMVKKTGKKVAPHVKALIVPGSQKMRVEMVERGYDKILSDAGFEFREAGCSMCLAMNPDKLVGDQLCASSSNRNFKGRQGSPSGRTLLMSPATVAASALMGVVADPRPLLGDA